MDVCWYWALALTIFITVYNLDGVSMAKVFCKPIICDLQEQCEEIRPSVRCWKVTDGLGVTACSSFFYSSHLIVLKIRHESEQFLLLGD